MSDFAEGVDSTSGDYPKDKKVNFLKLSDGNKYTIRILEEKATKVFTHYLNKYSIACLGDNCPICKRTIELSLKNPDTFRKDPEYAPRQKRYYVNVLDKTLVKKCPSCNKEELNMNAGICNDCSIALVGPEPADTVKVLAKGPAVFGQLNEYNKAILDETGEPKGIHNFDLTFVVSGKGKETKITIIPLPTSDAPVEGEYELYDVSKVIIALEADEMLDAQRGISLGDIFAARRATSEADNVMSAEVPVELQKEVDSAVDKLFTQ